MMRSLLPLLLSTLTTSFTTAQPEFTKPDNYTYNEPEVFQEWCDELKEMFGPTCTCTTTIGNDNNVNGLDLNHEINCDPLQGNSTCIEGITINSARVWLKATSVGEEGNFTDAIETAITDFYVWLDDTSVGTISWRYNSAIGTRRTGCEAVFGGINCPRCGACDAPPNNKSLDVPVHLGVSDIFRGISGECRYGNVGGVGLFNTCDNGDNILTNIVWRELEIRNFNESGPCPSNEVVVEDDNEESGATTMTMTRWLSSLAVVALIFLMN